MIIIIICSIYLVGVIAALASIAFINAIKSNNGIIDDYTEPSLALLSWIVVLGVLVCSVIAFIPMITNKLFDPIYKWFYEKFKKWDY